jgi:hypothetical protein
VLPLVVATLVVLTIGVVATTTWWSSGDNSPSDAATPSPSQTSVSTTTPSSDPSSGATTGPTTAPSTTTSPPSHSPPPTFTVTADPAVPAGLQGSPQRPHGLTLPSGSTLPVQVAPTGSGGVLQVPEDITEAGWWDGGARLGEEQGAMVLASHVDSTTQGVGPFAELMGVAPGDQVTVTSPRLSQVFAVDTVEVVPGIDLDTDTDIFSTGGDARLVLITCAGPYEPDHGGYQNLAVVTATPTGPVEPA